MSKVALVVTLPNTRSDGTALDLSAIASLTLIRDINDGNGPQTLGVVEGPFADGTVSASDDAGDAAFQYGGFITDTQSPSVQGAVSSLVTPTAAAAPPPPAQLAPASAPSITATLVS